MTRIVVLANSWKHDDWCIAGIDLDTGKWIRPVTELDDGRIPHNRMKLGGYFPRLLDILEIPLDSTGPDFGFESENRTILPGKWYRRCTASPNDVRKHTRNSDYILHNKNKYVTVDEMQAKPFEKRTTLQLIETDTFCVRDVRETPLDKHEWKGIITSGGRELDVKITDPVFADRLNNGYEPSSSCVLTMSLSMPYKPSNWDAERQPVCWKLIAGVIELHDT
jgi:hypothetical protein